MESGLSYLYYRMSDIVTDICSKHEISSVLEIGTYTGDYVLYLREKGFEAYGINLDERSFSPKGIRRGYLLSGNASCLDHFYKDKLFDLILANRTLSFEAFAGVMIDRGELIEDFSRFGPIVKNLGRENGINILRSAYNQLKNGKYFVAVEDSIEELLFKPEDARDLGYKVIHSTYSEMILQKP